MSTWALIYTFNTTILVPNFPGNWFKLLDQDTASYEATPNSLNKTMTSLLFPNPKKLYYIGGKRDFLKAQQAVCVLAGVNPSKVKGSKYLCATKIALILITKFGYS